MKKIYFNAPQTARGRTVYDDLAGVDFSQSEALIAKNRSPWCLNMISDNGKNPVKRAGWKTVYRLAGSINNMWFTYLNNKKYFIVHSKNSIYLMEENPVLIKENVADLNGTGIFFASQGKDGFYIFTGKEFLLFDGEKLSEVAQSCYIPKTIIARRPTGGGESYEDINLLTPKRCEQFVGTAEDRIYQLSQNEIDMVDFIEVLNDKHTRQKLSENVDYSVDKALGKITFTKTYPAPVQGEDNVFITYSKTVAEYKEKIENCTTACSYGLGGFNRMFVTGNPKYPAYDFWSDVYRPDYFPDMNYAIVGSANTRIMGYLKISDNLAIIKQDNQQDTTIFIRSGSLDSSGNALFTVKAGIGGIGAVSKNCFAMLNDDPLFLSHKGVYALTNQAITSENVVRNRSLNIDTRLTAEKNLENAVACQWNGFYILSVNGNCYIMDSKRIASDKATELSARYECYHWDNVNASAFAADGEILWFGDRQGNVRRFKTDVETMDRYSDDGTAIKAVWTTPYDDDGYIERYKTLVKKGCLVVLSPFHYSGCKVYYGVDGESKSFVNHGLVDITCAFKTINFARFTFNANKNPKELYFNKKQRKYKRLQLIFENHELNEGFGLHKIVKTYTLDNHSKNRG